MFDLEKKISLNISGGKPLGERIKQLVRRTQPT